MLKKYEIENIIKDALYELDGQLSDSKDGTGNCKVMSVSIVKDANGDLLFTFQEDVTTNKCDKYRIKILDEK